MSERFIAEMEGAIGSEPSNAPAPIAPAARAVAKHHDVVVESIEDDFGKPS